MENSNIQIQFVPIELCEFNEGQIEGVPSNPRTREDAKQKNLEKSIEELPEMTVARAALCFPYNGKYVVIGGNRRLEAQRALGRAEIPIIALPADTPVEKLRRIALLDNESTGKTDWDKIMTEWDTAELKDWGVELPEGWGDNPEELKAVEDKYVEPEKLPAKVKLGDIWQLGDHRLMCGDSTKSEDVHRLMDGEKADMVFTDPPYGMKKEAQGIANDNLNFDKLLEFNKKWIPLTFENTKENGSWYCWGIDEPLMDIYSEILKPMIKRNLVTFRNLITWDKDTGQGQLSQDFRMYPIADEKCLFVLCGEQDMKYKRNLPEYNEMFEPIRLWFLNEKKRSKLTTKQLSEIDSTRVSHYWAKIQFEFPCKKSYNKIKSYCAQNGITAFMKDYDEIKKEYDEIKKEFYESRSYFDNTHDNMNNVWHFPRTSGAERELTFGHATPKPIALCERAIKSSSRQNEIVMDLFGGSGSTLIACEQLNRKCRMMELDPHYCDVIINRWEKLTGKKAHKIA